MPPVPATFTDDAVHLLSSIERRYNDALEHQIPRLQDCKGPLALQQDLAAELREDIELISSQVHSLSSLIPDQRGPHARKQLQQAVESRSEQLIKLKKESRAAVLASKRTIDSLSASNRAALLRSNTPEHRQGASEKTNEDLLMKTSNDVTEALRRTIGLMQGELEKSVLSNQMLEASTASLNSTSSAHDVLTNVMGTSKQIITALEKSDWLDRLILASAMCFFFIVVLFILKQRIFDRGMRLAFWWTRFIPDFSGDQKMLVPEKAVEVLSSLAGTATSVAVSIASTVMTGAASSSVTPGESSTDDASSESEVIATSISAVLESTLTSASDTTLESSTSASDPLDIVDGTTDHRRADDEL